MNIIHSRIKRGLGCIAASSLILGGASFALAAPANAAPGDEVAPAAASAATNVVAVNLGNIALDDSKYLGWHEGYKNATPAFSIATDGLHLGTGTRSQILNGLVESGKPGLETKDLLALITGASTTVNSGPVVFQVAVTWGTGATAGWSTLRSAPLAPGAATFKATDMWESSKPVGTIAANTPTTLKTFTDALTAVGNVRYSGFGVQSETAAVVPSITWDGVQYNFTVVPTRIAGADRYDTAVKISQTFTAGVTRVYVASGQDYPDALSAGPAAAHFGGPLLLTTQDTLPVGVAAEIGRLSPDEVVLVGGKTAVSANVESQLAGIVGAKAVKRISGADRYETSRLIAKDAFGTSKAANAYIATGANFPDALAASPAAAHGDGPVVLVIGWEAKVDAATKALLTDLGVTSVNIAGGPAVVTAGIEADLKTVVAAANVKRFEGKDRYETAAAINTVFGTSETLYIATGAGFADALSGAALAGLNDSPLFTTTPECLQPAAFAGIKKIAATNVTLLGGADVLHAGVESLTSCK